MALKEAIDSIWSSDYVQKNPNKSYKGQYPSEYTAVAAYLNGGNEPPDWASYSKMGKGLVEAEKHRRGEIVIPPPPPPPPPPPTADYRFATLTDRIEFFTNRFQPIQSTWKPGFPDGTPWPNSGGLWPIDTPHGPGFKMCLVPQMLYPASAPDSQECNFNAMPSVVGPALGKTQVWEWTEFWPSGSENPAGQLTDGTWVCGEGANFAMSSPFGNTVGHHLFMDYSANHGGIGWRFGRQTYSTHNTWVWTQYPQPFLADTFYHHKWESKWSAGSDGYFKVTTTKEGGSPLQWISWFGPTLPSGWNIWKYMFTYRLQGPLNRHQTKHMINMRVTIL